MKKLAMKRISISAAIVLLALNSAMSQEKPIPQPGISAMGTRQTLGEQTLGDLMTLSQLRHIKLWHAGKAQNWPLVTYLLQQLEGAFNTAALMYIDIPIEQVLLVNEPLGRLREAARTRSSAGFSAGFSELTSACNSCHVASKVGFIRMRSPSSSPFSDQDFSTDTRR